LCYELALWAVTKWPSIRFKPWFTALLDWCKPDWTKQKVQSTLLDVDRQVEKIKVQWEKAEQQEKVNAAEALASKAQKLFPDATVTPLPNAIVPSVMIIEEAPDSASDAIKALGGSLRITRTLDSLN
jgi:hypothetical protein